ncbi:ornithine cyclodeaminase family protein [Pelomonas sp. SE-A7]|uniref:ornithine cyclodeaminase family protein n=1 Tax=Pelomonas sp. SE-A7 TaxID=3054953 RepID=UPI00259D03DD|nr:ornithine cyclodeaminase family protein [Pelomonas sp. SE-A7]MDM4768143.1 ornithine cyclodeaminase family protein [Pelomonas sp. SE-A7]
MQLITEAQVASVLTLPTATEALRRAFTQFGQGQGAVLARHRAAAEAADGAPLLVSAMGALLPQLGVLGTKVYSTRSGQFQFLINLFSTTTGEPLATLEANELTRLRTAASTAVAVDALARPDAKVLAIYGAGTQARVHAEALLPLRRFERVLVCARSGAPEFAAELAGQHGLSCVAVDAASAASQADVVVTCTRSTEPLFDGALLRPGTLVAAVGSSKPAARELDDALLARASLIAVEWKPAAETEAGEFCRAAPGVIDASKVAELGQLLALPRAIDPAAVVVYKSVGIGLEDVAIAHQVYQALQAA